MRLCGSRPSAKSPSGPSPDVYPTSSCCGARQPTEDHLKEVLRAWHIIIQIMHCCPLVSAKGTAGRYPKEERRATQKLPGSPCGDVPSADPRPPPPAGRGRWLSPARP